ncbi:hypothetical protein CRD60_00350 [Bifidobacterium aemilianum]|uniref:ABC transporter permease n=1 Tax=Bifidobacterium aemilianum TaxID=2493120 RepID=A0A366K9J1_9BIFI|nr:putative ABC transporter permease [Bifidobacterium aemilianum]RBP98364.1 hypothetical protein CRD60_00350 [Bifidobacterium aemilianum]
MLLCTAILFLWFMFYACLGWAYESIIVSIGQRQLVNRGFLNGPLCPIYGVGAVLCVVLLDRVHNPLLVFLASALGASLLEYVTSWAMEQIFHARWWDYSQRRFNLNGRICLLGATVFGLAGLLINEVLQPFARTWTALLPVPVLLGLALVLLLLLVLDMTVTLVGLGNLEETISKLAELYQTYALKADESMQTGRETVSDTVKALSQFPQDVLLRLKESTGSGLNAQQRRILRSFPRFRLRGKSYDSALEVIRNLLKGD